MKIPDTFQATWPTKWDPSKRSPIAKALSPFLYFNRLTRDLIFRMVIPSWEMADSSVGDNLLTRLKGERVHILTPDKGRVEAAYFPGERSDKAIIYAPGVLSPWERCGVAIEKLKESGASILVLNARGTGKSRGRRYERGYILDYLSAYQYLMKKKQVDLSSILLVGHSMGAAVGSCAAAFMKEEHPSKEVNIIGMRSFASLQGEISALLKKVHKIFFYLLYPLIRWISFDINTKAAWDKLDKKTLFFHPHDEVIAEEVSLNQAVLKEPKGATKLIKMEDVDDPFHHNRSLTPAENQLLLSEATRMLQIPHTYSGLNKDLQIIEING